MNNPYTGLLLEGPHEVGVGHALITMVEPYIGWEREYNRWYEDDHMFSGALFLPWLFTGRRWMATYDLQQLRYTKDGSTIIQPASKGCYLSTYWITPGRLDVHKKWSFPVYRRLVDEKRVNNNREHVFTSFQDKLGTVYRDQFVPKEVFTLMDPSAGLVLEIVDAHDSEKRDELANWLLAEHLPSRITSKSPISSAIVFCNRPSNPTSSPEVPKRVGEAMKVVNDPRRLTILWFLTEHPQKVWDDVFIPEPSLLKSGGLGEVLFCASFIPAEMGTNLYDNILRAPSSA